LAEALFSLALVGYAEAVGGYVGEIRRPGLFGRLGTWGVRVGWLAQTALLVAQAVRAASFPWSSWAGSLSLFVWLVVGGFLIWGCRARYRLLGLVVAPLAFGLLALAGAEGGADVGKDSRYGTVFLVLHVGLVLAAFAGFTLAAALSALYLRQERQLRRRRPNVLRVVAPSLTTLDDLVGRTIAFALPALTLGILVGLARLRSSGGGVDALMAVTLLTWLTYGGFLVLRYGVGWRGRRAAYLALAGFAFVVLVRIGLAGSHFS
jgi:ABC-type uncharacterized transport system permease subunit